ncbi:MAG: hypothetical protein ACKOW9_04190 [Candidatus Paceibacterota bacterium]
MEKPKGIDYLNYLEKTGRYVFHGSPDGNIDVLVPKQAHHIPDLSKLTEMIEDGKPAVSATPYADFAVFRAIINRKNAPSIKHSGFGFNQNKQKEFRLSTRAVLEEIKNKKGYVYVFYKKDFEPYSRSGQAHEGDMEWRSYTEVSPVEIVEVQYEDLKHIEPIVQFTDSKHMV